MEALLIVDMQEACLTGQERYQLDRVVENVNQLSSFFRSEGKLVVHIQHEELDGPFLKYSDGWKIASSIAVEPSDTTISKSFCDAYIDTMLHSTLEDNKISRVVICGCATDFCVDSTVKGAISGKYDVVVVSDAHTTSNRPHVSAESLVQHFNWNWQNLITGDVSVEVLTTRELCQTK